MSTAECLALGRALFAARERCPRDLLVVASSDMSHFHSEEQANILDHRALAPLLAFDPAGLHDRVRAERISMCGVGPATAMLEYCRLRGAGDPQLKGYTTSAETSGDRSRVVGYAGVVVPQAVS
jgi:AmmeMemoRadiSam system protein B